MSANPAKLVDQIAAEGAAWSALLDTLSREEHALVTGQADALPPLAVQKLDQLNAVSSHARNRLDVLKQAGCTPDAPGMASWLAQYGTPTVRADWQSLCKLEDEARACNLRIGKLIDMRLSATRQSLNVLMQAAVGRNGLYDPSGQSVSSRISQPLTAA